VTAWFRVGTLEEILARVPPAPPRRARRGVSAWLRHSEPGDKLSARWEHQASGWEVRHCGHPTANWPYYATTPEGRVVVASNGRGWRTLKDAQAAVEELAAGR